MTTITEAKEAMALQFITAWASETPVTIDNEEFDPPVNPPVPWVRFAVRHTASTQETLGRPGNRRYSRIGSAFVQVFTPQGIGTARADELARRARLAFEGLTLAGTTVRFLDVIIREIGVSGQWYQVVVEADFEYNETR